MTKTVKVLDPQHVQYEDGTIIERSASPLKGPPRDGLRWLPCIGEYVHEALFDEFPCVMEVEEDDDGDAEPKAVKGNFDKRAFENYLAGK